MEEHKVSVRLIVSDGDAMPIEVELTASSMDEVECELIKPMVDQLSKRAIAQMKVDRSRPIRVSRFQLGMEAM